MAIRRWRQRRAARRQVAGLSRGRRVMYRNLETGQTHINRTHIRAGRSRYVTMGRMIGNRLRNTAPRSRGTAAYERRSNGLWIVRDRPTNQRMLTTDSALRGPQRTEGAGGGRNNPSEKAYRNSARYRERHGLAAGA